MRSQWKFKNYVLKPKVAELPYYFSKSGLLNPLLSGSRVMVYTGSKFKNFKVREEMLDLYLRSFVLCRPGFNSIRTKFSVGGSKKKK
jgi:ribosomal protein S19